MAKTFTRVTDKVKTESFPVERFVEVPKKFYYELMKYLLPEERFMESIHGGLTLFTWPDKKLIFVKKKETGHGEL